MDKSNKTKGNKVARLPNPLEVMKDVGSATAKQMRDEASKIPGDFMEQLMGFQPKTRNFSGELIPGEALEVSEVFSGRYDEIQKTRKQVSLERQLLEAERVQVEKKSNELRMNLHAIRQEILVLAQKTDSLTQETEIAAMQAPIAPGIYHVIFFEKLLEFIKSFRKKVEEAAVWLQAVNGRAAKKNAWGARYKQHGAKYLLSGEHYLQRSAG